MGEDPEKKASRLAIAALGTGILALPIYQLTGLPAILGLVLGILALRTTRRNSEVRGEGLAIIGIILSSVALLGQLIFHHLEVQLCRDTQGLASWLLDRARDAQFAYFGRHGHFAKRLDELEAWLPSRSPYTIFFSPVEKLLPHDLSPVMEFPSGSTAFVTDDSFQILAVGKIRVKIWSRLDIWLLKFEAGRKGTFEPKGRPDHLVDGCTFFLPFT